jgi:hypothetical protein
LSTIVEWNWYLGYADLQQVAKLIEVYGVSAAAGLKNGRIIRKRNLGIDLPGDFWHFFIT